MRPYSLKRVVIQAGDNDVEAQKAAPASGDADPKPSTDQGNAQVTRGSTDKQVDEDAQTATVQESENAKDNGSV